MKVKDILKLTSTILNRKDLISFFDLGVAEDYNLAKEDGQILLSSYNIVLDDIATETLKLSYCELLKVDNGFLSYGKFKYNPISIISVKDKNGKDVEHKILPTDIKTDYPEIVCEYYYSPNIKGIDDECELSNILVPKTTIAYGIATEFCLIKGMFEEASVWHQKYVNGLDKYIKPKKCKNLKCRKWI